MAEVEMLQQFRRGLTLTVIIVVLRSNNDGDIMEINKKLKKQLIKS